MDVLKINGDGEDERSVFPTDSSPAFGDKRDVQILTFAPAIHVKNACNEVRVHLHPIWNEGVFNLFSKLTFNVIVSILINMMSNLIFPSSVNTKMALSNA